MQRIVALDQAPQLRSSVTSAWHLVVAEVGGCLVRRRLNWGLLGTLAERRGPLVPDLARRQVVAPCQLRRVTTSRTVGAAADPLQIAPCLGVSPCRRALRAL